ncbi:hypothetical protein HDV05_005376 [Chytridiales sp. JEL 0842]|nr:hypothetical protein HDV05_005376 [Chytridiales sp. JEL 0842]
MASTPSGSNDQNTALAKAHYHTDRLVAFTNNFHDFYNKAEKTQKVERSEYMNAAFDTRKNGGNLVAGFTVTPDNVYAGITKGHTEMLSELTGKNWQKTLQQDPSKLTGDDLIRYNNAKAYKETVHNNLGGIVFDIRDNVDNRMAIDNKIAADLAKNPNAIPNRVKIEGWELDNCSENMAIGKATADAKQQGKPVPEMVNFAVHSKVENNKMTYETFERCNNCKQFCNNHGPQPTDKLDLSRDQVALLQQKQHMENRKKDITDTNEKLESQIAALKQTPEMQKITEIEQQIKTAKKEKKDYSGLQEELKAEKAKDNPTLAQVDDFKKQLTNNQKEQAQIGKDLKKINAQINTIVSTKGPVVKEYTQAEAKLHADNLNGKERPDMKMSENEIKTLSQMPLKDQNKFTEHAYPGMANTNTEKINVTPGSSRLVEGTTLSPKQTLSTRSISSPTVAPEHQQDHKMLQDGQPRGDVTPSVLATAQVQNHALGSLKQESKLSNPAVHSVTSAPDVLATKKAVEAFDPKIAKQYDGIHGNGANLNEVIPTGVGPNRVNPQQTTLGADGPNLSSSSQHPQAGDHTEKAQTKTRSSGRRGK